MSQPKKSERMYGVLNAYSGLMVAVAAIVGVVLDTLAVKVVSAVVIGMVLAVVFVSPDLSIQTRVIFQRENFDDGLISPWSNTDATLVEYHNVQDYVFNASRCKPMHTWIV